VNEIMIAGLALCAGFSIGYVWCDYLRWSKDYEAYRLYQSVRRQMCLVEPDNGEWDNGRVA
jgi:hypothetical protein